MRGGGHGFWLFSMTGSDREDQHAQLSGCEKSLTAFWRNMQDLV